MTAPTAPVFETARLDQLKLAYGAFTNPRTITGLAKSDLKALAADIDANNLQNPVDVVRVVHEGEEHLVVDDGQRRFLAVTELGWKEIPIRVTRTVEYTDAIAADMTMAALRSTTQRTGLSSYEQAESASKLLALKVPQQAIGLALGRSKSWTSTMLTAWKKSTPDLRAQWKAGKVTDEQFQNLADVPSVKQAEATADIISLRESGDRTAARKVAKEASEKSVGKVVPRKIEVVTMDAKTGRETTKKMLVSEAKKKGLVRNENAAGPALPRPSGRLIEEYACLRKGPFKGPRDPYVRGMLDMAAFVVGELAGSKFEPAFGKFVVVMAKQKNLQADKVEKKAKGGAKGSKIVARAKAKASAGKKPAARPRKKITTKARRAAKKGR